MEFFSQSPAAMMWNNDDSFLAPVVPEPRKAPVVSPSSGSEADDFHDFDFNIATVTTPVQTPCVLSIARRDVYWGVEKALLVQEPVQPSFIVVQAPRLFTR